MKFGVMDYEAVQVGAGPDGRGGTLFLIPVIDDDWPQEFKSAVAIRREATITGRCQCGAMWSLPSRAERRAAVRERRELHGEMVHENDCPANDEAIGEIARRHGLFR
jgi:hypothetical protein